MRPAERWSRSTHKKALSLDIEAGAIRTVPLALPAGPGSRLA
jgi:hypothetical protein